MAITNQWHGSNMEPLTAENTVELLRLAKAGNQQALDRLCQRCLPALRRWARGRVPPSARGGLDASDVVEDAVNSAMQRLEAFEAPHQGALQAYLRQAVVNRISDDLGDEATSPLERTIGADNVARYETALQRLNTSDREAVIGRLELQYSYEELAIALDKPTPGAARDAVTRAMKRLAEQIQHA